MTQSISVPTRPSHDAGPARQDRIGQYRPVQGTYASLAVATLAVAIVAAGALALILIGAGTADPTQAESLRSGRDGAAPFDIATVAFLVGLGVAAIVDLRRHARGSRRRT